MNRVLFVPAALGILSAATALSAAEIRTADLGDVRLAYEISGAGPPCVLIHGWTHDLRSWDLQVDALREDLRVLRYDRRGWGRSGGRADVSADPVDLARLLDELGIASAHVVGHSAGARVALRFALAYPERVDRLVLYGAPPPADFCVPWSGPDALPDVAGIARKEGLDALGAAIFAHPLARGFVEGAPGTRLAQEMWAAYDGRDLLDPAPPSGATPAPTLKDLARVTAPTLVVSGETEMPYFRLVGQTLAYALPEARAELISGGGHAVHLQQPERFNAAVLRFLIDGEDGGGGTSGEGSGSR